MVRDNRNIIRPVVLKIGVVLALSVGGIIYAVSEPRESSPPNPIHVLLHMQQVVKMVSSQMMITPPMQLQHLPPTNQFLPRQRNAYEDLHISKHIIENPTAVSSSSDIFDTERDGLFLPEFNNELVKELTLSTSKRDIEAYEDSAREYTIVEMVNHDQQEIKSLKNIVKTLKERESTLEIQLLEYYGLKEQETAIWSFKIN
ncbi:hypothetical protein K7X08_023978 [Anisodus acutangulus]|uniref:Uncharacterized protein n=1 Tax=Anisodus acutangulus TaxID=402998 RepID=A0A9Q1MBV6_9SOLA|nr:hypothetical protein K7X08_023978 [Anisodus acutangulus]